MAKDKAGLYVDTQDLFRLLYETQFEIPKRDRLALTNRMLDHCEKIIGYFALTYYVEEDTLRHIDGFIAEFEALKVECRFAIERIYNSEQTRMKIRELLARIDEGVQRWRKYISGTRQEPRPGGAVSP